MVLDVFKKEEKVMIRCVLVVLSVYVLLCSSTSLCLAKQTLTIKGTGDSEKLMRILGQYFEKNNPGIHIVVPPSIGSNGGIKALVAGKTDLARTARPLKENEKRPGMVEIMFASSPVVFVVNKSVTGVVDINFAEVVGIFTGRIQNWKELGGPNRKIYLVDREADDSSRNMLIKLLPGFPKTSEGKVFFTVTEALQAITAHEYTIGFLPLPATHYEELKVLTLNGFTPDDPTYPCSNSFYIVSHGQPSGIAKQFIDFLFSAPSQKIISELGLIPLNKRD